MSINGKSVAAISPLLVFVVLYLVTSIIVRDFYKVPITVAFMVSSVYAVATMRGVPLEERVKVYSQGAGSPNRYGFLSLQELLPRRPKPWGLSMRR